MDGEIFPLGDGRATRGEHDHLRFLTCGSVDDGKSTLIGRLLHDTGQIAEDQLVALERDSLRFGAAGGATDYALLLDGLEAEREQGITIDVAYRYFSTPRRSFIVADTPGHEQYTRNMATGASTCDAAVILVDATRGVTAQTERHSRIVSLFGIRRVILAINKIDLIDGQQAVFEAIKSEYAAFAAGLAFQSITTIPISARHGDNIVRRSDRTPWHEGPTLLEALEATPARTGEAERPFRFIVQYVNRPHSGFRGYAGTVVSGRVRAGDQVVVCPSGQLATVSRIAAWEGDRTSAQAGDAVTLVFREAVDVSRGDVLALPHSRPAAADRFSARLVWMDDAPFAAERSYLVRMGARSLPVKLTLAEAETGEAAALKQNQIATCTLSLPARIAFDRFEDDPALGALVLVDRETGAVAAAGVATKVLGQAAHIHPTADVVSRRERERLNGHDGGAVWLTGLSGAGKSTIAGELERLLHARGVRTMLLDGDNLRHGLNRDLGFSDEDRAENVRRTGEVARLFADAGVISLCALISPSAASRQAVRARFGDRPFLEVFVEASLEVCRARDPKGLYARADAGVITNLTGVGAPYEAPLEPDLVVDTHVQDARSAAERIAQLMEARGLIPRG